MSFCIECVCTFIFIFRGNEITKNFCYNLYKCHELVGKKHKYMVYKLQLISETKLYNFKNII